jgi:hypothetical protein
MPNVNCLNNYMDRIRFKKRAGQIRRETMLDFWYVYVNGVKNQEYFIEKEMHIPYFLIIRKIDSRCKHCFTVPVALGDVVSFDDTGIRCTTRHTTSVAVGNKVIFRTLHAAKTALLQLLYDVVA